MTNYIQNGFIDILNRLTWMDTASKEKAIEKVAITTHFI